MDILAGEVDGVLNIHSRSRDWRARTLSPLWNRPFKFKNKMFGSFEGFFNGIKYLEDDPKREYVFASCLGEAQRYGTLVESEYAWWCGKKMPLGSPEHLSLVRAAHRASILDGDRRKFALLATETLRLTHKTETPPDPHYPPEVFCADLMELRAELLDT